MDCVSLTSVMYVYLFTFQEKISCVQANREYVAAALDIAGGQIGIFKVSLDMCVLVL